jgi:hypothetical protein
MDWTRKKKRSTIAVDAYIIDAERSKNMLSLYRREFRNIKYDDTILIPMSTLVLLHFEKHDNHVEAWRNKVIEVFQDNGIDIELISPKVLKSHVMMRYPDLMYKRGIFSCRDQSRVLGRYDDDRLPSQKIRFNLIKTLATKAELSWMKDKSANQVLKAIEKLKRKS